MKNNLDSREWKESFVKDIFTLIQRGKRLIKNTQIKGDMPYISSTASKNGVDNFLSNKESVRIFNNCITIANSGSVGASFFHPYSFVASDHVTHLKNEEFGKYIYLFVSAIANRYSEKYNFNREINDARLSREKIILPITLKGQPDYQFMEDYSRNLLEAKKEKYLNYNNKKLADLEYKEIEPLKSKEWKEFFIEDLFDITIGKNIDGNKINKTSGYNPYITRRETNNGLDGFINYDNFYKNMSYPVITIGNETAYPFVQSFSFFTGTKVNIMKPKIDCSNRILFFISESIKQQRKKYSYSYTINSTRLKRQMIKLPITLKGQPDYQYMEQYIKNMEYKKRMQYASFIDKQNDK